MEFSMPKKRLKEWLQENTSNTENEKSNEDILKEFDDILSQHIQEVRANGIKTNDSLQQDFIEIKKIIQEGD